MHSQGAELTSSGLAVSNGASPAWHSTIRRVGTGHCVAHTQADSTIPSVSTGHGVAHSQADSTLRDVRYYHMMLCQYPTRARGEIKGRNARCWYKVYGARA
eukprot:2399086-Rhodomonas_salina.2